MPESTIVVNFQLTKQLDDYESVKVGGGVSIPANVETKEDFEKTYKHWLKIVQNEVIEQTYKYYNAVKNIKAEKFKKRRDDLK